MRRFKFDKLVRNLIVRQQIASGAKPHYRRLNREAHKRALVAKIIEEASELLQVGRTGSAGEIADIQQALDDFKKLEGLTDRDIAREQKLKNEKVGSFSEGIFVEYVEVAEGDKWIDYYLRNADRYPELP